MTTTIQMGAPVKDIVTGFKGHVTGICDYITGCRQVLVTPKGKDGKYPASQWIDIDRLTPAAGKKLAIKQTISGFGEAAPTK